MDSWARLDSFLAKEYKKISDASAGVLVGFQSQIKGAGYTVLPLPGLFLPSGAGAMQAFPDRIANIQPTVFGRVITPAIIKQRNFPSNKQGTNAFVTEWLRILGTINGLTVGFENVDTPRFHGGEVHCITNTIREPFKK